MSRPNIENVEHVVAMFLALAIRSVSPANRHHQHFNKDLKSAEHV